MDDREYSPQRATRVAAAASMGTLLTLVGFFAGGGDASGAASADTASRTSNLSLTTTTNPGTTSTSTSSTAATTTTTVAPCTNTYTVQSGDYWLLLAQEADVALADLYSLNGAGPDTALFAGASICLPDGATVVTVAPATVAKQSTTLATNAAASAPAPVVTAAQTTRTSG